MFRIFDKNIIAKELFTVNLDSSEIQSVMGGNLFLDHLELNPDDCCVVEQNQEIQYPTYDELEDTIREMTLFERYKNKLYQLEENEIILNNEIIRLEEGQYLDQEKNNIVTIPVPESLLKKVWDREAHIWKEGATEEEIKIAWFDNINRWKPQVLEGPFRYIHSDGKIYHQKLRVGKDDTLLSTAIQALIRNAEILNIEWAFDDENNSVLMTLEDLRKLQDTGFVWIQCVYEAERELKSMKADFTKNIEFFKEIAIKHLDKYRISVFKAE